LISIVVTHLASSEIMTVFTTTKHPAIKECLCRGNGMTDESCHDMAALRALRLQVIGARLDF
jgi:hypothetical protein